MSFAFSYAPADLSLATYATLDVATFDIVLDGEAGLAQEVLVPAGAWIIAAAITNPDDVFGDGGLSWSDSGEVLRVLTNPGVQLRRDLIQVGEAVVRYAETRIVFPVGAAGIVSVVGPLGFEEPVISDAS
jgi:hypothetical protein